MRNRLLPVGLFVAVSAVSAGGHPAVAWDDLGWDAANTSSYDHSFSAFYDTRTSNFRAFWCATEGGLESERAVTASNSAPWSFSSSPSVALESTGVRVVRAAGTFSGRLDTVNFVDQTMSSAYYPSGYSVNQTIGYLRREKLTSVATARIDECAINSTTHFTSKVDNDGTNTECAGAGGTPVTLGYAYNSSSAAPGLSERFRCVNPSSPYDHFATSSATCESTGYTNEGSLGYWRDGASTEYFDGAYREVSPFPDGAYVCPSAVIRTDKYYMLYTASGRYYAGGPFNQVFLATSPNTDGVTFTPEVDAAGDPVPVLSYRSGYVAEVLGRSNTTEIGNAFGVGGARLAKVGSTYYYTYVDSSDSSSGTTWQWHQRTSSTIGSSLSSALQLKDGSTVLTSSDMASSVPVAVYDENPSATNKWWMYSNNHARTAAYWSNNTDGATGRDYSVTGLTSRTLSGQRDTYVTVHGTFTNESGNVDTRYGWYVYTPYSSSCSGNNCGIEAVSVSLFCTPLHLVEGSGCTDAAPALKPPAQAPQRPQLFRR